MMHWLRRIKWRLDVLFKKGVVEDELSREIQNHLDAEIRDNINRGLSPEDARRKAMLDFGGVERVKEQVRDTRGARPLDDFIQDIRYAVRGLIKRPIFAGAAVLTLALGIGAATAMFSVVRHVLLRPLPYEDPEELVMIWGELRARGVDNWTSSPPEYGDYLELESYQAVATIRPMSLTLTGGDQAEQIEMASVSHNFFDVLSTPFHLGRPFVEDDIAAFLAPPDPETGPPALHVVFSYDTWQRRFGSDPEIVGRSVDLGGRAVTVVGILPQDFSLLLPAAAGIPQTPEGFFATPVPITQVPRRNVGYRIVARLKAGVTPDQAQAEMDAHWARMREDYQLYVDTDYYGHVVPLLADLVAGVRPMVVALFGAVLFVLLIACANVAGLLLVRAQARTGEMSIRSALGGTRGRLARQMLSEGLVLAAASVILGLGFARAAISALFVTRPVELPRMGAIGLDLQVLGFSILVTVAAVLIFGMVPAVLGSRTDLARALQGRGSGSGRGGRERLRSGLVVAEVALSLILLIGAGLMVRSSVSLARTDPGYDPHNLLTFQAPPPPGAYRTAEARMAFARQMQDRISGLPGVVSVSGASGTPFSSAWSIGRAGPEGALQDESLNQQSRYSYILPGYFETMGASLEEGRTFTPAEHADSVPVVMVDALLARALWPSESAVGKILVTRPGGGDPTPHQVVGVVEHQKMETLTANGEEILYYPFRYYGARLGLTWTVRTAVPPESLVPLVRQEVAALNPDTPLTLVRTMESYLAQAQAPTRFALALIGFFAGTALILAVIGLYGILASGVQQRTSEIGVRVAFGAKPREIISLILGKGMRLVALGIFTGMVGAVVMTRFMTSLLVGVEPVDIPTFTWIGGLFTGVAVLACFLPARRAARVDPVTAIQAD